MERIFFNRFLLFGILISIISIACSCSRLFGPKPNKSIQFVLEFDSSNNQIDTVINTLNNRLYRIARGYKVTKGDKSNQLKIFVDTHYPVERIKKYIINRGVLDFYETYQLIDVTPFLQIVNRGAKAEKEEQAEGEPLFDLMKPPSYSGGAVLFMVAEQDTAQVNSYISSNKAGSLPGDKEKYVKFLWGVKEKNTELFPLYALRTDNFGEPSMSGKVIVNASTSYDQLSNPVVAFRMNEEGAKKWESLTGKAFRERSQIAMVLNNRVHSAPEVTRGPIVGGKSEVTGNFSLDEAVDLANLLTSGSLPKMELISMEVQKIE